MIVHWAHNKDATFIASTTIELVANDRNINHLIASFTHNRGVGCNT